MKSYILSALFVFALSVAVAQSPKDKCARYISYFNSIDTESVINFVPNKDALKWMEQNIPMLDCPDSIIERTYYFRWWAIRKHLKQTPDGFVFTEFITNVKHAGKYNTVSSALGHHVSELRWLRDNTYLDQYMDFWLHIVPSFPKNHLQNFSSWFPFATCQRFLVDGDSSRLRKSFASLENEYLWWEKERQVSSGLYWQYDVKDAMEESISGSRKEKNRRPTLNSYMYGNAWAMAKMADVLGLEERKKAYQVKANGLRKLVLDSLWDDKEHFFKALHTNGQLDDAKEALGFIPWYFNLPLDKKKYAQAFDELLDTAGFSAPWGITTAERRHPGFRTHGSGHGCEWDGAVWPFATTQTLQALGNVLSDYKHKGKMTHDVFYEEFKKYAASHQKNGLPYLGEYQDPQTGYWLKGNDPRSSYYNHSAFADLLIHYLIGLKPREDNILRIQPLISSKQWPWFRMEHIYYHKELIDIQWDETGKHYGTQGLIIWINGKQVLHHNRLDPVTITMN